MYVAARSAVADLVHPFPLVELDAACQVDHQPALLEPEVHHLRADGRAHRAVGAVATQHVGGKHGLVLAGELVGEVHPDPALIVLGYVGDLDVPAQADRGLVLEVGPHHVLEPGLVEHVGPRVSVYAVAGPVEHGEHAVVPVDQLQPPGGPGHSGELLGDAESRQNAVDLVIEVHRPGPEASAVPAVQHQAVDAVLPQEGGGGEPDGAGAHDDDRCRIAARSPENVLIGDLPPTRMRKIRRQHSQHDGRGHLAHAVTIPEMDDDCAAEEDQQSAGCQSTDQRHERPREQPEDRQDLQEADASVGRDTEAHVLCPGAHGRHCGELGRASGREGHDQDRRRESMSDS